MPEGPLRFPARAGTSLRSKWSIAVSVFRAADEIVD
jgi:hypothetical protein